MKILITGNMGYVGPSVVKRLRHEYPDATLVGLDVGFFAHSLTDAATLPETLVDIQYFADVRTLPAEVFDSVDAVVHLAAISNDPMGTTFEEVTYDINYRSSVEVAKQAKARGVKTFVFASSCSMYGLSDGTPRTETSSVNPLTAYAKSKVLTEEALQTLAGEDFKVTCLRFATACGMSDRLRLDLVVNDFVACAVTSKKITILSDGTPWRPLIHVRDMARAIDWAIHRKVECGGEFLAVNTGSSVWNYRVKELAEAVVRVMPDVAISINKDAPQDSRSYRVDFSLFEELAPDHQPQVDLMTAIRELRDGLHQMGFNDPNFRSSKFMRLEILRSLLATNLLDCNLKWTQEASVV